MPLYGTKIEELETNHIKKNFPDSVIINPSSFQENPEIRSGGMEFWLKLVEECDRVVFTRFLNKITSGVGLEINHALNKKIPVHELNKGKIQEVTKPLKFLTHDETIKLYRNLEKFNLSLDNRMFLKQK